MSLTIKTFLAILTLTKDPNGYKLELGPCFGLNGTITARSVRIEIEPVEAAQ